MTFLVFKRHEKSSKLNQKTRKDMIFLKKDMHVYLMQVKSARYRTRSCSLRPEPLLSDMGARGQGLDPAWPQAGRGTALSSESESSFSQDL